MVGGLGGGPAAVPDRLYSEAARTGAGLMSSNGATVLLPYRAVAIGLNDDLRCVSNPGFSRLATCHETDLGKYLYC